MIPKLVIWKAELSSDADQTIDVPEGAEVLSVAKTSGGTGGASVWFACDPTEPVEKRQIFVRATGSELPDPAKSLFVGTLVFNYPSGSHVVHVFTERLRRRRRS